MTNLQLKLTLKSVFLLSALLIGFTLPVYAGGKQETGSNEKTENPSPSQGKTITFIELGSDACIPCVAMQPIMEKVRTELGDQVEVIFYDVWTEEGQPFGRKYKIRVIPTQVFLDREGNEIYRHEGFFPEEELYRFFAKNGVKL